MKTDTAIGLMSGTSLDGIDAALIRTNGTDKVEFGPSLTVDYDEAFVDRLRNFLGSPDYQADGVKDVEHDLTLLHVDAVEALLKKANLYAADIDIVGFHGHTLHHDPSAGLTVQLGDGALLADRLKIDVVSDFRSQDVKAGGQGAPLVPIFHAALVQGLAGPFAIVNIGGVANVTWVGTSQDDILAFDTGPGNAPLNDWVFEHTGQRMDRDGNIAAKGQVHEEVLARIMNHAYFDQTPPKSLDRQDFKCSDCEGLSLEDGAATLTALIAQNLLKAQSFFPDPVKTWAITGGGRLNPELMKCLQNSLDVKVVPADDFGWDGDALEAQAFAYLAVRSVQGLPITFSTTTGAAKPLRGGTLNRYRDLSK